MLAAADEVILRAGAIAAAVIAIGGAVAMVARWVVRQFTTAIKAELGDIAPKVDKVVENTTELKRNGGSSVADAIARIEASQRQFMEEQRRQAEQLRRHQEAQEDLRAVLIEHLADHRKV